MRIRRKKHLGERLKSVSDLLLPTERDIVNVLEAVKDKRYFEPEKIFGNDNPVEMEIGCGKGGFVVQKAKLNVNINYFAVELLDNIIVMATENAKTNGVSNVRFINSGAEYLPRYIKEQSISNIYLNFSPPFPPNSYEGRRLTCDRRVQEYKDFLSVGGAIWQKTDDKPFFEYSFKKFKEHGFEVQDISEEINQGKIPNVVTEYEKKFRSLDMPIYALRATKI